MNLLQVRKLRRLNLQILPNFGEIQISSGEAIAAIISAAKENIWTIKFHVQTPKGVCREGEYILAVGSGCEGPTIVGSR
jgi:hypothetical protein